MQRRCWTRWKRKRPPRHKAEKANRPPTKITARQLVSVSQDTGAEFFEQARLSRSKARDEALEALNDALKDTNVSEEEQKALTTRLSAQVNNITLETKLETLIKSKGFADCVVNLEGEKANVTVMR